MRIDDLNGAPGTQNPGSTDASQKTGEAKQQRLTRQDTTVSEQPDKAEVSQLAQSLAASDPGRIDELRLKVQSGRYEVSAQEVASALIDAHTKE